MEPQWETHRDGLLRFGLFCGSTPAVRGGRRGGHPGSRGGRHQLRVPLAGKVADIWDSEREQSRTSPGEMAADFQEFFKLLVKHETLHFVNLKLNSTNDKGDSYSERVAS